MKVKYKNWRKDLGCWEELRIYKNYTKYIRQYVYTLNTGTSQWEVHRLHKPISDRYKKYMTKAYIPKKVELIQGIDYNIVAGEFKLI